MCVTFYYWKEAEMKWAKGTSYTEKCANMYKEIEH
jgi:hypothetical protein